MYIVVSSTNLEPQSVITVDTIPDVKKKLDLLGYSSSWIVAEFDNATVKKEFIIGDGTRLKSDRLKREIYNAELDSNTMYAVDIAFVNEYKGVKRYRMYKMKATTMQNMAGQDKMETDDENESTNYGLFALILLLLVPLIICAAFR